MERGTDAIGSGALARNTSRFRKLHADGRAAIRPDAERTLRFMSTAELVAAGEAAARD